MSIEDIIKRGFKIEASYTFNQMNYSYRLKDKADHFEMEERISDADRAPYYVRQSYRVVRVWSKQGIYPVGINNVPREGMMVMKFSDGSLFRFDHSLNFVKIQTGNNIDSQAQTVSVKEQKLPIKKTSEEDMKALDRLIDAALEDFVVTDEERATLLKKADSIGLSRDEFKMILDSRIQRRMKEKPDEKIEEKKKGFFARLFGK